MLQILFTKCQSKASGHGYRFKNELYSIDSTAIDLCVSLFPWASFRKADEGIELRAATNHKGNFRDFVTAMEAREQEVFQGRTIEVPKGSNVAVDRGTELTTKGTVEFTGGAASKHCPITLSRIGYRDSVCGDNLVFLTNNFPLAVRTIAAIYKFRWQFELFFKWIKQNLKIKSFMARAKER